MQIPPLLTIDQLRAEPGVTSQLTKTSSRTSSTNKKLILKGFSKPAVIRRSRIHMKTQWYSKVLKLLEEDGLDQVILEEAIQINCA